MSRSGSSSGSSVATSALDSPSLRPFQTNASNESKLLVDQTPWFLKAAGPRPSRPSAVFVGASVSRLD